MPRRPWIDGFWRRLTVVGAVVLAGSTAWAHHGGTLRLGNEAAGPYLVSVLTDPSPPEVGSCQVMIAVMRPATRAPILDAVVRVRADRIGAEPIAAGGSRTEDPAGIGYVAALPVPTPGA